MGGGGGGAPSAFMEHSHLYHPNGGAHHGSAGIVARRPEMEFLDINITKDSSLLLHATYSIHSLSYWRILKKTTYSSLV
jgi:hypothetical protein